ncbi:MAG TPA: CvpA family protein [Bacillota bacterium]|jgi:membrane protein required for colicin V production|nr:CvpA family protein [Bacillota bacterium]
MNVSSIDWLSAVLLLMLAADFIVGFRRGLVRQVIDFAGIILAILAAMRYWRPVAALLERWFAALNPPASNMLGFLAVLIVALVVVDLLGHALSELAKAPGVSLVNGFGGALLRVARGCLLISVVLSLVMSLNLRAVNDAVRSSELAMRLTGFAPSVWKSLDRFIPDDLVIPGLGGSGDGATKPANRGVI